MMNIPFLAAEANRATEQRPIRQASHLQVDVVSFAASISAAEPGLRRVSEGFGLGKARPKDWGFHRNIMGISGLYRGFKPGKANF